MFRRMFNEFRGLADHLGEHATSFCVTLMPESTIPSWEVVLYALYINGGTSNRVHTEDIAKKAFELAPDALSWIRHPQFPDKESVRKHLVRLREGQHGGRFVIGRTGRTHVSGGKTTTDGWQLTQEGVQWIRKNEERISSSLRSRQEHVRTDRQHVLKSLQRIRTSNLFKDFLRDPVSFAPPMGKLAELLRCRIDAEDHVWSKRFASLRNQAQLAAQEDVLHFLDRCENMKSSHRF